MQNPCVDSYHTTFPTFAEMFDYHLELSKNSRWTRSPVKELKVEPLSENSPLYGNLSEFAVGTSAEAVEDTAKNLGLALRINGQLYPIRDTAYKSLLDRAKIGGTALPKLSREALSGILNSCLNLFGTESLVLVRDEKVSAVHSGDPSDYSVLPIEDLLKILQDKLDARFAENEFESGYSDHSITSASWRMPKQKEDLLGTYTKLLAAQGKTTMARYSVYDIGYRRGIGKGIGSARRRTAPDPYWRLYCGRSPAPVQGCGFRFGAGSALCSVWEFCRKTAKTAGGTSGLSE